MVPTDVVDLSLLDKRPDLGGLQVRDFVVVGGGEMGAHGAGLARYDDAAAASGGGGRGQVFGAEAGLGAGVTEEGGVVVGADGADVED